AGCAPGRPAGWPGPAFPLPGRRPRPGGTVHRGGIRIAAREGGETAEVPFSVRGEDFVVRPGESVVVPLADQGPVREGKPEIQRGEGAHGFPHVTVPPATDTFGVVHEASEHGD